MQRDLADVWAVLDKFPEMKGIAQDCLSQQDALLIMNFTRHQ